MKIIFILLMHLPSMGAMILARLDNKLQFDTYTKANKISTFSDQYLQANTDDKDLEQIIRLFERAQMAYYSNEKIRAKELYTKIILLKKNKFLTTDYSDAMTMSYLKLASLESSHDKMFYWLKKALLYNPYYKAPKNSLRDDTYKKYLHLKNTTSLIQIDLNVFKGFDYLIINNSVVKLKQLDVFSWPEGYIHVSLISNHFATIHKDMNTSQLQEWKPSKVAMASGTCAIPVNYKKGYDLFFSDQCIIKANTQTTSTQNQIQEQKETQTSSLKTDAKKSIFKNVWFWAGLLTAGYLIDDYKKNSQEPDVEPVVINY